MERRYGKEEEEENKSVQIVCSVSLLLVDFEKFIYVQLVNIFCKCQKFAHAKQVFKKYNFEIR